MDREDSAVIIINFAWMTLWNALNIFVAIYEL